MRVKLQWEPGDRQYVSRCRTHKFTRRGRCNGVVSRENKMRPRSWCNAWFGGLLFRPLPRPIGHPRPRRLLLIIATGTMPALARRHQQLATSIRSASERVKNARSLKGVQTRYLIVTERGVNMV